MVKGNLINKDRDFNTKNNTFYYCDKNKNKNKII